jgi:competence ComEA-like helix-hairpin-helix protein
MFNLTGDERRAILFLAAVICIGIGISFLAKRSAGVREYLDIDSGFGKLDLNRVSRDELLRLGIAGAKTCEKIISLRDTKGRLANLEELKEVRGISDKRIEKLREFLYVE